MSHIGGPDNGQTGDKSEESDLSPPVQVGQYYQQSGKYNYYSPSNYSASPYDSQSHASTSMTVPTPIPQSPLGAISDDLERCNFCPEPGNINIAEKIAHQAQHINAFFSCAACSGTRKFEEFDELVKHIHSQHCVTDYAMVLETIILPQMKGALKMFKCGIKNCGKTFMALPEKCLLSHVEAVHGNYFIKIGKGKYILKYCRICGDKRTFASDEELTQHILTGHPNKFGEILDSCEEEEEETIGEQKDQSLSPMIVISSEEELDEKDLKEEEENEITVDAYLIKLELGYLQ